MQAKLESKQRRSIDAKFRQRSMRDRYSHSRILIDLCPNLSIGNMASISASTLKFLSELESHNTKEWFLANKPAYEAAQANMLTFVEALLAVMGTHDRLSTARPKDALYRIYNDVRFHKNKPPYNPRFAGSFGRVKPQLRGGYTFQVKPGHSYVACGFFGPNADDLKRIRVDIDDNYEDWQAVLANEGIVKTFGQMRGELLKTAPAGYPKDHPAIELLRYKSFVFRHSFTDAEVLASDFVVHANACYKAVRPFFDYMSEVLTTDRNGISFF